MPALLLVCPFRCSHLDAPVADARLVHRLWIGRRALGHGAVVDSEGTIVAAVDKSLVGRQLDDPVVKALRRQRSGFLETTIDHWDDMSDDTRRQAVSRAAQNAQRLRQLTGDVLDTSAMESGQVQYRFESGDLRSIVADAVEVALTATPERTIAVNANAAFFDGHVEGIDGDFSRDIFHVHPLDP